MVRKRSLSTQALNKVEKGNKKVTGMNNNTKSHAINFAK